MNYVLTFVFKFFSFLLFNVFGHTTIIIVKDACTLFPILCLISKTVFNGVTKYNLLYAAVFPLPEQRC